AGAGRGGLRRPQGVLRAKPPARREALQRLPRAHRLGRQGVLPPQGALRAVSVETLPPSLTPGSCFLLLARPSHPANARAKKNPPPASRPEGGKCPVKLTAAAPRWCSPRGSH